MQAKDFSSVGYHARGKGGISFTGLERITSIRRGIKYLG
jgi:hypothetical protein